MCGIYLTLAAATTTTGSTDDGTNLEYCYNSNTDETKPKSRAPSWLRRRGPDGLGRVRIAVPLLSPIVQLQEQQQQHEQRHDRDPENPHHSAVWLPTTTTTTAPCSSSRRSPTTLALDHPEEWGAVGNTLEGANRVATLHTSVLRMRSAVAYMAQPVRLSTPSSSTSSSPPEDPMSSSSSSNYYLAWNGEIYQMLIPAGEEETEPLDCDCNDNDGAWKAPDGTRDEEELATTTANEEEEEHPWTAIRTVHAAADTTLVATHIRHQFLAVSRSWSLSQLEAAVSDVTPSPPSDNETEQSSNTTKIHSSSTSSSTSRNSRRRRRIHSLAQRLAQNVFARYVNAEYAFCLLSDHGVVYYGRDPLGRRSLVVAASVPPSSPTTDPLSASASTMQWQLASVAHRPETQSASSSSSRESASPSWTEVIPGVVHAFDFQTGHTLQVPIRRLLYPQRNGLRDIPRLPVSPMEGPKSENGHPLQTTHSTLGSSAVEMLRGLLSRAVFLRCGGVGSGRTTDSGTNLSDNSRGSSLDKEQQSTVAVLFSGGLDSTVIAALALEHVSNLILLTVSFVDTDNNNNNDSKTVAAADAMLAKESYLELQRLYPNANIEFRHRIVDWDQLASHEAHIRQLIHPKNTVMDVNIATALWFAADANHNSSEKNQINVKNSEALLQDTSVNDYCEAKGSNQTFVRPTKSRVLLSGLGADELMGGYGRHRVAFEQGGLDALRGELDKDLNRLWDRNLGRDDRVLSDTSQEVRFPFLDAAVMQFLLQELPLDDIVEYSLPPGQGDKRILRLVAESLGLSKSACAVKRAIQFGSRIAHVSDKRRFGSRRKATGENACF